MAESEALRSRLTPARFDATQRRNVKMSVDRVRPMVGRHLVPSVVGIAVVAAGSVGGCGARGVGEQTSALAGGAAAAECQWPGVVRLGTACSGVLVHPRAIIYAGHCGTNFQTATFGNDSAAPAKVERIDYCIAHAGSSDFGNGQDVGVCVLHDEVHDVPVVLLASACERRMLAFPRPGVVVGFGATSDQSAPGLKQTLSLDVTENETEYVGGGGGLCPGDSGAPLFVRVPSRVDPAGEWRVLGIASSSPTAPCVAQASYFTKVTDLVGWIEETTSLDVSPCVGPQGEWISSPLCTTSAPGADAACANARIGSATCGDVAAPIVATSPPGLSIVRPADGTKVVLAHGDTSVHLDVQASVRDVGGGIRRVGLALEDGTGGVVSSGESEVWPFDLPGVELPAGDWTLRIEAEDFVGNRAVESARVHVVTPTIAQSNGCMIVMSNTNKWSSALALLVALATTIARSRRVCRPKSDGERHR